MVKMNERSADEVQAGNKVYRLMVSTASSGEGMKAMYDNWTDYDTDTRVTSYKTPEAIAEAVAELFPRAIRSETVILDVASGTGFLGEQLVRRGFRTIDGLDPSDKSLDAAREKNIYRRMICDYITDKRLDIDDDTYDIIVSSGAINPGHLPAVCIHEMARITKPGGFICIGGNKNRWDSMPEYHVKMAGIIHDLETAGVLTALGNTTLKNANYLDGWNDAILIRLHKN